LSSGFSGRGASVSLPAGGEGSQSVIGLDNQLIDEGKTGLAHTNSHCQQPSGPLASIDYTLFGHNFFEFGSKQGRQLAMASVQIGLANKFCQLARVIEGLG